MSGPRKAIVVAATPTPNGDLHLGHLAGPYLSGDVHARYLRAIGRQVIYTTCTDDSQTYVTTTADRQGTTPADLCADSTAAIRRSLTAMGISMAGLPPIDDTYRRTVLDFVTALHTAGRFQLRTVRLPVATRSGEYLFDGLVSGTCPVCLADSSGGACEACGHPNNFDELLDPRVSLDPTDTVSYRDTKILVLPMEDYRDRLTTYYATQLGRWRPHAMQLVHELLARRLPDIPITMPGRWGIPAPFAQTPGQLLYPWIEAMPAVMYSTWWSAAQLGECTPEVDEHWRSEYDAEVVYFHGFDNVYHWGLMDLVLLMAHGDRYVLPAANVCNEFYNLGDDKFSTSRNHLVRSGELLSGVPRDLARFYLALTAPEQQRTTYSDAVLRRVVAERLVAPWNRLAGAVAGAGTDQPAELPTTATSRGRSTAMLERFHGCYALPGYSMSRAAETVLTQLDRLCALADDDRAAPGDLLLEVRTLLAGAAPILIDTAERAGETKVDLGLSDDGPATVTAFALPRLPEVDAAGDVS